MTSDPESFGEGKTGYFVASSTDEFTRGTVRGKHEFVFDEPEYLPIGAGNDEHPSPVDHMFASLVACQISVLKQCLEKARVEEFDIEVNAEVDRRSQGDVPDEMPSNTGKRIEHISLDLDVRVPREYEDRAKRCLEVYDVGCIVGQSFRAGIEYTPNPSLSTY